MVQKHVVEIMDDFDPTRKADETIPWGFRGQDLEIDLTAKNAAAFEKALKPYLRVSRKVKRRRAAAVQHKVPAQKKAQRRRSDGLAQRNRIRDWAATPEEEGGGGFDQSRVGRLKQAAVEAYFERHPQEKRLV